MGEVQKIAGEIFIQMMYIASDPIFLVVAIIIIVMYQKEISRVNDEEYKRRVEITAAKDILRGIILGSVISLTLKYMGIVIPLTTGLLVLLPVTILLGILNTRWVCFAYVIPVVFLLDWVLRLCGIDIIHLPYDKLIVLIGVLHLIEGILVVIYGMENTYEIPLYRNNKIVKGRVLQKFWIMPLAIFYNVGTVNVGIPLYTVIGYRDIAVNITTKKQALKSGCMLLGYSLLVLSIGGFLARGLLPIGLGILIIPLLHESMILLSPR